MLTSLSKWHCSMLSSDSMNRCERRFCKLQCVIPSLRRTFIFDLSFITSCSLSVPCASNSMRQVGFLLIPRLGTTLFQTTTCFLMPLHSATSPSSKVNALCVCVCVCASLGNCERACNLCFLLRNVEAVSLVCLLLLLVLVLLLLLLTLLLLLVCRAVPVPLVPHCGKRSGGPGWRAKRSHGSP